MAQNARAAVPVHLHRYWLGAARAAWLIVVLPQLSLFAVAVPAYWTQLHVVCPASSATTCGYAQLTPAMQGALERVGGTIAAYAAYTLVSHTTVSLVFLLVGALIFWRKRSDWYGLFTSCLLMTFGATGPLFVFSDALEYAYPALATIALPYLLLSWLVFPALGLFLVTFPDGRFVPRWSWVIFGLWVSQGALWEVIEQWPPPLLAAELVLVYGSTLVIQIYRYRRVSDAAQRQQTKWFVFGFAFTVALTIVEALLTTAFPILAAPDGINELLKGTWDALLFTAIPLTIGIAILRYRLWDIDPIINRTLVYGALTAAVVGLYVLVVGYLGALLQARGNVAISLLATGVVAVVFQPLRDRLQQVVNRLMYGERDNPYAVLARLGQRLQATLAPAAVLPTIVETIASTLKLPYVAIALGNDDQPPADQPSLAQRPGETVASYGAVTAETLRIPLVYQAATVGQLVLGPRAGETFSPTDHRLLADLARHAGVAVHAVRLTTDLQRMTVDLQRSREHLVTSREEERRRLRRDLHDGLGPVLASLTFKLEAARNLLRRDVDRADGLLQAVTATTQTALTDIRRLVYDLRPPALDELGLVSALREQAAQCGQTGVQIAVDAPERSPLLPAAVEVAAYRIAQEALTNVVRHAHARTCVLRLWVDAGALGLEVCDDGQGLPATYRAGVGLHSMRERAAELGGTCIIERLATGGTRVAAQLPLPRATTSTEDK